MLLALLIHTYSHGVRSSRAIEGEGEDAVLGAAVADAGYWSKAA